VTEIWKNAGESVNGVKIKKKMKSLSKKKKARPGIERMKQAGITAEENINEAKKSTGLGLKRSQKKEEAQWDV